MSSGAIVFIGSMVWAVFSLLSWLLNGLADRLVPNYVEPYPIDEDDAWENQGLVLSGIGFAVFFLGCFAMARAQESPLVWIAIAVCIVGLFLWPSMWSYPLIRRLIILYKWLFHKPPYDWRASKRIRYRGKHGREQ